MKLPIVLLAAISTSAFAQELVLSDFNTLEGSLNGSWVGQASISAGTLVVGGTATNVNGYSEFQPINATGFNFIAITAKIDAGNASNFAIQFSDDNNLTEYSVVLNQNLFTSSFTTLYVPLEWANGSISDLTQITSWSFGGGSVGNIAYRYTIDKIALTVTNSAIPEPSTAAALGGLAILGFAAARRQRRSA